MLPIHLFRLLHCCTVMGDRAMDSIPSISTWDLRPGATYGDIWFPDRAPQVDIWRVTWRPCYMWARSLWHVTRGPETSCGVTLPAVQSHLGVISDAAVGESIPDYKTLIYQLGEMWAAGELWKGPPSILVEDLTYGVRLEDCKISICRIC